MDEKIRSEYNAATVALKRQLKTKQGGKKDEARFAIAYQALVRAGLAPQIKAKYRVNK
jgi:hypothetical protein